MYFVGDIKGQVNSGLIESFAEVAHVNARNFHAADTTISLYRGVDRSVAIMQSPTGSIIVSSPTGCEDLCAVWNFEYNKNTLFAIDADGVVTVSGKDAADLQKPAGFFGDTISFNPELYSGTTQRAEIITLIDRIERAFD